MKTTRREFIQGIGALTVAASLKVASVRAAEGGNAVTPAINPVYLTGSVEHWPLAELASMGYRGLEITPDCLDRMSAWKPAADKAGLGAVCVNAMPELRPYLTGSLSDGVERRRRATLDKLLQTLKHMRDEGISFLVVAPSRLAENYQSPDQARALLVLGLRELASAGDSTILLGAAPFRLFASSGEIAGIVDEVALPNVGAALDVGHALLGGENPAAAAKNLGPRLRYVQVHDADVRPGLPLLDRHLPLGQGTATKEDIRAAVGSLPCSVGITPVAEPLSAARTAIQWVG